MKKSLSILLTSCLLATSSFATLWRVNNITGVNANFSTLTAAVTAASIGDTIYIEPSPNSYGSATVNKKLTIIGNGYFGTSGVSNFNTNNSGLQANMMSSMIGSVTFIAGSEFSTLMGCYLPSNHVYCQASNLTIKRNMIDGYIYLGNLQGSNYVNLTNIDIRQNVIWQGIYTYSFSTNSGAVGITNVNIQNNIIAPYYYTQFQLPVGISGFIMNNSLYSTYYTIDVYNFQVNNNILLAGNFNANNNVFFNNVAINTAFGNANGNQQNISTTALFTNYGTGSADSSYVLNPTGPGIGAGFGGVNVGPYGGPDPYRKSGIPPVPSIYLLSAPATTTTSTLPVTISTRSND
jgi:hypothetical protein